MGIHSISRGEHAPLHHDIPQSRPGQILSHHRFLLAAVHLPAPYRQAPSPGGPAAISLSCGTNSVSFQPCQGGGLGAVRSCEGTSERRVQDCAHDGDGTQMLLTKRLYPCRALSKIPGCLGLGELASNSQRALGKRERTRRTPTCQSRPPPPSAAQWLDEAQMQRTGRLALRPCFGSALCCAGHGDAEERRRKLGSPGGPREQRTRGGSASLKDAQVTQLGYARGPVSLICETRQISQGLRS